MRSVKPPSNSSWSSGSAFGIPPHDLAAVQDLVVEDFVLTSAGTDIQGRDAFAKWIAVFQTQGQGPSP